MGAHPTISIARHWRFSHLNSASGAYPHPYAIGPTHMKEVARLWARDTVAEWAWHQFINLSHQGFDSARVLLFPVVTVKILALTGPWLLQYYVYDVHFKRGKVQGSCSQSPVALLKVFSCYI